MDPTLVWEEVQKIYRLSGRAIFIFYNERKVNKMCKKLFKLLKICDRDQFIKDCKELDWRISEFYTAVYDVFTGVDNRQTEALKCCKQLQLIADRYPLDVYEAIYYSHYESITEIRRVLVADYLNTELVKELLK